MNEGKSKPEKGEPFPYHEIEQLPAPSLRSLTALQETSNLKRKMSLPEKKSLVLALRAMLPAIAKRKEIAEKNVKIFQRFEEQLNCRSQREIKDASRLQKIAENLLLVDVDISTNPSRNEITFKTEIFAKEDDVKEYDNLESITSEQSSRKREHSSTASVDNAPKRYSIREVHPSFSSPLPSMSREVVHDSAEPSFGLRYPARMKDNPDMINCSEFWKEVNRYYACFDESLINMIMSDTASLSNSPFSHTQSNDQSSFSPMDCLLSCLVPDTKCREVLQTIERPSKRVKKIGEDDSVVTAASRRELANLFPSLVNELYSFGLVDDSLFFPEVQTGSIAEEIIKLNKELEECIEENHLYCISFRNRFKEELKRDMKIREDEQKFRQLASYVKYLREF